MGEEESNKEEGCQKLDEGDRHLSLGHILLGRAGRHQGSQAWDDQVEDGSYDGDWFGNAGHISSQLPDLLVHVIYRQHLVIEVLGGPLLVVLVINLNSTNLDFG